MLFWLPVIAAFANIGVSFAGAKYSNATIIANATLLSNWSAPTNFSAPVRNPAKLAERHTFGDITLAQVSGIREIESKYAKSENMVFYLKNSKTFLTRKDDKFWDVVENLDNARGSVVARWWNPFAAKKAKKVPWVEFRFANMTEAVSEDPIPVSPCHDEMQGQGGSLTLQLGVSTSGSLSGSFGVSPIINGITLGFSTKSAIGTSNSESTSLTCNAKEGEVVQAFLYGTRFLYFTPYYRIRQFDPNRAKFEGAGKMCQLPEKRIVLENDFGMWGCASSAVTPLRCSKVVTDLSEIED